MRALVGHTSRALLTVESYLARPAQRVEITSPADYYRAARVMAAGPEVADRGRAAGQALGADPHDCGGLHSSLTPGAAGLL